MKIGAGSKLVMIGDSITDAGRARPIGEGSSEAYGRGYPLFVAAALGANYPERRIRVLNMGIGGNTVRDLESRWQTDVLDLQPNWLSIKIGINDVWRQFDSPLGESAGVPLDEFEATLEDLVVRTRPMLDGVVLMTPYLIEAREDDAMRARMDEYGAAVKRVAARQSAILVDTQIAINAFLEHYYSAYMAGDRVHPSHIGHWILAREFLKAIEFDW